MEATKNRWIPDQERIPITKIICSSLKSFVQTHHAKSEKKAFDNGSGKYYKRNMFMMSTEDVPDKCTPPPCFPGLMHRTYDIYTLGWFNQ